MCVLGNPISNTQEQNKSNEPQMRIWMIVYFESQADIFSSQVRERMIYRGRPLVSR